MTDKLCNECLYLDKKRKNEIPYYTCHGFCKALYLFIYIPEICEHYKENEGNLYIKNFKLVNKNE